MQKSNGGYIKLYRSLTRWEWYQNLPARSLFIHLLLTVNFEDTAWQGIVIRRGQRVASYERLAGELNLSVKQIRTALSHLCRTKEVAHEATSQYSLFTVVRYDEYQSGAQGRADGGQKEDKPRTGGGQQDKNIRKNIQLRIHKEEGAGEKKTAYAPYVTLTKGEYDRLAADYGEAGTKRIIEILDNYKGASGKEYACDYRAILSWVAGRYGEEKKRAESAQGGPPLSGRFDYEAIERVALENLKRAHLKENAGP